MTTATMANASRPFPVDDFPPTGLLADGSDSSVRAAACPLRAGYESVGVARAFVRRMARSWHVESITDDLELVTTELVANALRHGLHLPVSRQSGSATPAERLHTPDLRSWDASLPVEVSLLFAGHRVMCVVNDPSTAVPVRRAPDLVTGSGRGLHLIESLSVYWGWTVLEREGHVAGKAVWTVLAVDGVAPEARAG